MKKITIFIALAATLCGSLSAQDTVWQKVAPRNGYFYNNWIDTTGRYGLSWCIDAANVIAKQFVTNDTLQVYGIAAMLMNSDAFCYYHFSSAGYPTFQDYLNTVYPKDPGFGDCEESLLLFQYRGGAPSPMQQLGDSLPVHYLYTPVTHWMMSNTSPVSRIDTIGKPVYERYFSAPQTVCDTFFVGYTQSDFELVEEIDEDERDTAIVVHRMRPGLQAFKFTSIPDMLTGYGEDLAFLRPSLENSSATWEFRRGDQYFSLYIFPILTPEPPIDTTVIPVDTTVTPIDTTTTGVSRVDMVGRYVSVSPNPAGDRATVLSSFGLTRIEAYDPQGRQLYAAPATGLKATLNVSAWPRGTALLNIHTPAGTTVKKLLLR